MASIIRYLISPKIHKWSSRIKINIIVFVDKEITIDKIND